MELSVITCRTSEEDEVNDPHPVQDAEGPRDIIVSVPQPSLHSHRVWWLIQTPSNQGLEQSKQVNNLMVINPITLVMGTIWMVNGP